jgi:tRNA (guanine10-N2)-dimethyltransferase
MELLFVLNQDHLALAQEELTCVFGKKPTQIDQFLALISVDNPSIGKRLALSHECYVFLSSFRITQEVSFEKQFANHCVTKIIESIGTSSFAFRFESHSNHKRYGITEQQIGKQIYTLLQEKEKKPTVALTRPEVLLKGIVVDNTFYLGRFLYATKDSWQERRAHLRPVKKPVSLSPRLAKALVNCLGADEDEIICDPFCGTGGFLIEAGLRGKKIIGSDIDPEMVEATRENCNAFGVHPHRLDLKDAFSYSESFPYMITDLPYFKNTKNQKNTAFYANVITHFFPLVKKTMILCVPDTKETLAQLDTALVDFSERYVRKDFLIYLHVSLQKRIIIITKME